jgi:hypothetical protein
MFVIVVGFAGGFGHLKKGFGRAENAELDLQRVYKKSEARGRFARMREMFQGCLVAAITAGLKGTGTAIGARELALAAHFFFRTSFVDGECTAIEFFAIHAIDRSFAFFGGRESDETETARAAGFAIIGDVNVSDLAELFESGTQIVFGRVKGEISNIKFGIHCEEVRRYRLVAARSRKSGFESSPEHIAHLRTHQHLSSNVSYEGLNFQALSSKGKDGIDYSRRGYPTLLRQVERFWTFELNLKSSCAVEAFCGFPKTGMPSRSLLRATSPPTVCERKIQSVEANQV